MIENYGLQNEKKLEQLVGHTNKALTSSAWSATINFVFTLILLAIIARG
jgi:t-SNARE complex subunit (syntaxin)